MKNYSSLHISDSIKSLLPNSRLGIVHAEVVCKENNQLNQLIDSEIDAIHKILQVTNEKDFPVIDETRTAYKICGKEPSRYRPSAEALLRRIRTGKGLYRINNLVDVINLLSISTTYSIGGFTVENIAGNISLDIGDKSTYTAIGRGVLNIEFMPGLRDNLGFFGTPTSDSERTMITSETKQILLVFYDFHGNVALNNALKKASQYLEKYCDGMNVNTEIVT